MSASEHTNDVAKVSMSCKLSTMPPSAKKVVVIYLSGKES
jgi:hypothetical protein